MFVLVRLRKLHVPGRRRRGAPVALECGPSGQPQALLMGGRVAGLGAAQHLDMNSGWLPGQALALQVGVVGGWANEACLLLMPIQIKQLLVLVGCSCGAFVAGVLGGFCWRQAIWLAIWWVQGPLYSPMGAWRFHLGWRAALGSFKRSLGAARLGKVCAYGPSRRLRCKGCVALEALPSLSTWLVGWQ